MSRANAEEGIGGAIWTIGKTASCGIAMSRPQLSYVLKLAALHAPRRTGDRRQQSSGHDQT
jgi:hypothetical protein